MDTESGYYKKTITAAGPLKTQSIVAPIIFSNKCFFQSYRKLEQFLHGKTLPKLLQ